MTNDDDEYCRLDDEAREFASQDRATDALAALDAEWRAAVEQVRDTIPRGTTVLDAAIASVGDACLNGVLRLMD